MSWTLKVSPKPGIPKVRAYAVSRGSLLPLAPVAGPDFRLHSTYENRGARHFKVAEWLAAKGFAMSKLLTAGLVHKLLDYDPRTGVLTWREHRGRVKAGDVAGTWSDDGIGIRVNGRRYPAGRLAVLWMTGKLPSDEINHRDGDTTNNRWANLRSIDRSQKLYNRGKQLNNSVGFKGVTFHKARRRFQAEIQAAGHHRHLGYFDTPEQAHRAYCRAARQMHGKYMRTR